MAPHCGIGPWNRFSRLGNGSACDRAYAAECCHLAATSGLPSSNRCASRLTFRMVLRMRAGVAALPGCKPVNTLPHWHLAGGTGMRVVMTCAARIQYHTRAVFVLQDVDYLEVFAGVGSICDAASVSAINLFFAHIRTCHNCLPGLFWPYKETKDTSGLSACA